MYASDVQKYSIYTVLLHVFVVRTPMLPYVGNVGQSEEIQ